MIGAIIGDIVGSRFEFNNYRRKVFDLFTEECKVTDDTIMTLAVAKALMETGMPEDHSSYYTSLASETITSMQKIGRKYPDCGYGGRFGRWMFSNNPKPYNSFGNGAAMRISPAGFVGRTEDEVVRLSQAITAVTHDHSEGIKGAEATAIAIYMARNGALKQEIRERITSDYYQLDFTIDGIRDTYEFNETCQDTVPQAIQAFLEADSFKDAIRTAISVGGDSDTLAAITGAIAEAYFGVPEELETIALTYMDEELLTIYHGWRSFLGRNATIPKHHVLTKYIQKFSEMESYGEWNGGKNIMPHVLHYEPVHAFVDEFHHFTQSYPDYDQSGVIDYLEQSGLEWNDTSIRSAKVEDVNGKVVLSLIVFAFRAERFVDGALMSFLDDGSIIKWLQRLEEIDRNQVKS